MLVRTQKRFRTTCSVSEIIETFSMFALALHVSAVIPAEASLGGQNPKFCNYLRDAASSPKTFLGPN